MSDLKLGGSSFQADWVIKHQIKTLNPKSVVDFGAGRGKNCKFVREILGTDVHITAVEGYKIAADLLLEDNLCDHVDNVLLEHWIDNNDKNYDLAIFGDVIEHLKPRAIREVINKSFSSFKHIIIVTPLYDIFQQDDYGNKLEDHKAYIGINFFEYYSPAEKHIIYGAHCGTQYDIMNVLISTEFTDTRKFYKKILKRTRHYILTILQRVGLARVFANFETFIRR